MKRSIDRILTTHTSSLPRPPALLDRLRLSGDNPADAELRRAVRAAVKDVVQEQGDIGIEFTPSTAWLSHPPVAFNSGPATNGWPSEAKPAVHGRVLEKNSSAKTTG